MFNNCTSLNGDIAYNSSYTDKTYATTSGGYLTYKESPYPRITIIYHANGGQFADGNSTMNVQYYKIGETTLLPVKEFKLPTHNTLTFMNWYTNAACTPGNEFNSANASDGITIYAKWTKAYISKTSNVSNDGLSADTSTGYGNSQSVTDTITIPGAEALQVTITYQTESTSYDWVCVYDGSVTPSSSNYNSSISGKLGNSTKTTKTFIVPGDTVRFFFKSDSSVCGYYGYYAVVTETTLAATTALLSIDLNDNQQSSE